MSGLHLEPLALARRGLVHRGRDRDRRSAWPAREGAPRLAAPGVARSRDDDRGRRRHPPRDPARRRGRGRRVAAPGRDRGAPSRACESQLTVGDGVVTCAARTPTACCRTSSSPRATTATCCSLKAEHRGADPRDHPRQLRLGRERSSSSRCPRSSSTTTSWRCRTRSAREVVRILQRADRRACGDARPTISRAPSRSWASSTPRRPWRCSRATWTRIAPEIGRRRCELRPARRRATRCSCRALAERVGHRAPRPRASRCRSRIRVGYGAPVLVISGPNTGGKTVALKTVGLLALMAQSGLHVPAAPGQPAARCSAASTPTSATSSRSPPTSPPSRPISPTIVEMTRDLGAPALVLLDEVGAGTDPTEGGALGRRHRGPLPRARGDGGGHHAPRPHEGATRSPRPAWRARSFGYDPDDLRADLPAGARRAGPQPRPRDGGAAGPARRRSVRDARSRLRPARRRRPRRS